VQVVILFDKHRIEQISSRDNPFIPQRPNQAVRQIEEARRRTQIGFVGYRNVAVRDVSRRLCKQASFRNFKFYAHLRLSTTSYARRAKFEKFFFGLPESFCSWALIGIAGWVFGLVHLSARGILSVNYL
jgi:hypothetical protein